ncbi:MAG TPA: flagellar biosynthetic protein FliR [Candidatus Krumholzibacteria bacterium]|nr:flagellar biosynthetic protein FliR [Candidatus Krumholzibacteria bacterium]HPD71612.1 flagellar biosynthetic protein FliR [Candidatus Krumholzibacteria bacterium]HRY41455.1 flagellar biosynthetic protein FliR [Candidatus Krumholzibacteria bacterium]
MVLGLDTRLVLCVAILALRLAVLLAMAPLMDDRSVPLLWRLAVAVPLAWALAPAALPHLAALPVALSWPLLALEAVNSLIVGALLTFAMNLVFALVRFAGAIVGMQVGFAIVNAYDPQTDSQISIIGHFYYLLAVLLFFALDAHHGVLRALVSSLAVAPPFSTPDYGAASLILLQAYSQVFALGLQAAAPVVLVLLLASAAMGVIVKTAPQIHVLVVGFPVQIAAGVFVLGASLLHFQGVVTRALSSTGDLLERLLAALT